jgi:hypothetical protein
MEIPTNPSWTPSGVSEAEACARHSISAESIMILKVSPIHISLPRVFGRLCHPSLSRSGEKIVGGVKEEVERMSGQEIHQRNTSHLKKRCCRANYIYPRRKCEP